MTQGNDTPDGGAISDREAVERTGRTAEVIGQGAGAPGGDKVPGADDLTGPAGDPAEGKR